MGHNHGRDYKEWLDKKEKEERLLRQLGVDEGTIQILRNYDYRLFLDDRRFTDHERATSEGVFLMVPAYDPVIIATPEKLLDEIEDVLHKEENTSAEEQKFIISCKKSTGHKINKTTRCNFVMGIINKHLGIE